MELEIGITIVWKDKDGNMHDTILSDTDEAIELLQNIQTEFDN